MKAGVYINLKTRQLLYVTADRRVTAYTRDGWGEKTEPDHAKEFKIRSRQGDAKIELEDGTLCHRMTDVPAGCNDHVTYLDDVMAEITVGGLEAILGKEAAKTFFPD